MWRFLLFIVVPAVELFLIVQVGARIGFLWTLLTIVGTGVIGAMLAKAEGLAVLARIRDAVAEGRMPAEELVDGILILLAAALLITPGFITDFTGFLALFPLTRPIFRGIAMDWLRNRVQPPPPRPPYDIDI